ncbi:fructose-6-phosphate aldolase [Pseudodesulfovibrio sp.]|nr:fructose-6-phosphate aldolase [Pseudodesulfovibrio sp.]
MQFFIDTANIDEIREAASFGLIDGATTNPTLMFREGGDWRAVAKTICNEVDGPVSLEVIGTTADKMLAEAEKLVEYGDNVVVKIPMTMEGIKAVGELTQKGIKTNVTLVFSAMQALLAAKAGATYVSPFVGRLDALGTDGMQLIEECKTIFDNYDMDTQIIVASIRHPMHVLQAALIGAHVSTIPFSVIKQLAAHPLTDKGLAAFLEDWKKVAQD